MSDETIERTKKDTYPECGANDSEGCKKENWGDGWPQTKEVTDSALPDVNDTNVGDIANSAHGYTEGADLPKRRPRCEFELAVEKYFGLVNWPVDEPIEEGSDYTQLCNLLAMYSNDKFEDLKAHLDAANKRVKELEDALADMITAEGYPSGLKSRIVKEFENRWMMSEGMDPASDLENSLKSLGIK
jgi:hypothetical protein